MIGHSDLGGGRTQEKEAMTQFPYVLDDRQRPSGTHIPVDALWEGPIQQACLVFFFFFQYQCSVFNLETHYVRPVGTLSGEHVASALTALRFSW